MVDGGGSGYGCMGVSHGCMHAHACMHTHTHTHTCMLNMLNMLAAICNFYTCIQVHVCMWVHAHACGDTPMLPDTPHPPAPSPELQGAQNTKI